MLRFVMLADDEIVVSHSRASTSISVVGSRLSRHVPRVQFGPWFGRQARACWYGIVESVMVTNASLDGCRASLGLWPVCRWASLRRSPCTLELRS